MGRGDRGDVCRRGGGGAFAGDKATPQKGLKLKGLTSITRVIITFYRTVCIIYTMNC